MDVDGFIVEVEYGFQREVERVGGLAGLGPEAGEGEENQNQLFGLERREDGYIYMYTTTALQVRVHTGSLRG